MNERRKFLRFNTNVTIEYRICRDIEIEGISTAKDLSGEGISFLISKRLERGTLLNMKLLLSENLNPVYLTGEVAWSGEAAEENDSKHTTGIKFFKIDNLDKIRLLDYVYGEWLKTSKNS